MRTLVLVTLAAALTSCAHIATVKYKPPHLPGIGATDAKLAGVVARLQETQRQEHREPAPALGSYLFCAQSASQRLNEDSGDVYAREVYNFAVARCIETIERAPLDPWDRSLSVPGPQGNYLLTTVQHSGSDRNPAHYDIYPTDALSVGGLFFQKQVAIPGLGAPVVAVGREEKTSFRSSFTTRRLYGTATAVIRFEGRRAQIEFMEPFLTERVTFNRQSVPLAADFTTPVAVAMTREHPEKLGLVRFFHPEEYADTARLVRLQNFDINRTPVIFVHGLQDTPASWIPMINALRADPEIRRRYQLWVYSYPSGYPYPYSAALFRKELDAVSRAFPHHKDIILVGHSMGGLVSRLMITDVGDQLWRGYFGRSPSQTPIAGEGRRLLEDAMIFNHRSDVQRVIFISTPHRGSELASNWIGRIATRLVRLPGAIAGLPLQAITSARTDQTSEQLRRIPNSIDTLSPHDRFVVAINKIPTAKGIPFHTIEGDRGRGNAPHSSDGVVPYWSSHLEGAQSERIVPSGHGAQRNPEAIAEVRRILKLPE